jgi:DUF3048 family protein
LKSRRLATAALGFGALAILAACSSTSEPAAGSEKQSGEPPRTTCPLTGEKPTSRSLLVRPGVAVKVENSPDARPQSGLDHADVVYEERVEGGITRFMAVFHCDSTSKAGPVRSGRFDDPRMALPFTHMIAASGSNAIVEKEIQKRMFYMDEQASNGALYRVPAGSTDVHSLFANVGKLLTVARQKHFDPPNYDVFHFGSLPASAKKAHEVTVNFVDNDTIEWRFKGGVWKRFEAGQPFMLSDGTQVSMPNLLVEEVKVDNSSKIVDVAGNPSPDIHLEGSGKAMLFRNGKVETGTWKISKAFGAPAFQLKDGRPMTFAPGPTWIELVPDRSGEIKGKVAFK